MSHKTAVATGAELIYVYATEDPAEAVARAEAGLRRKIAEAQRQLADKPHWTVMCFPPSACPHDGNCPNPSAPRPAPEGETRP